MKLFVYHTPERIPDGQLPDCAVVIDVLRATTTMATALQAGVMSIQAFSNVDKLFAVSEAVPPEKRLRAGERGGKKVDQCDLGNSPLDYVPELVQGRQLFMTTTNGTRCLEAVQDASQVITAALINRQAVVNYLLAKQPEQVWFVGSGWTGDYALEDTVCAGAVADMLLSETQSSWVEMAGNDELVAAVTLYRQWQSDLTALLAVASHGQRLLGLGGQQDLDYCAMLDTVNLVPIQRERGILVAH